MKVIEGLRSRDDNGKDLKKRRKDKYKTVAVREQKMSGNRVKNVPVINRIPTAIGYESDDSNEMLEERSKYSRYSVEKEKASSKKKETRVEQQTSSRKERKDKYDREQPPAPVEETKDGANKDPKAINEYKEIETPKDHYKDPMFASTETPKPKDGQKPFEKEPENQGEAVIKRVNTDTSELTEPKMEVTKKQRRTKGTRSGRSKSKERDPGRKSHSRSRSREVSKSDRAKMKGKEQKRSRSKSLDKKESRSRSKSLDKKESRSRSKSHEHGKSRSRSKSKERKASRERKGKSTKEEEEMIAEIQSRLSKSKSREGPSRKDRKEKRSRSSSRSRAAKSPSAKTTSSSKSKSRKGQEAPKTKKSIFSFGFLSPSSRVKQVDAEAEKAREKAKKKAKKEKKAKKAALEKETEKATNPDETNTQMYTKSIMSVDSEPSAHSYQRDIEKTMKKERILPELDEYSYHGQDTSNGAPALVQCLRFYQCGAIATFAEPLLKEKPNKINNDSVSVVLPEQSQASEIELMIDNPIDVDRAIAAEQVTGNEVEHNVLETRVEEELQDAPALSVKNGKSVLKEITDLTLMLSEDSEEKRKLDAIRRAEELANIENLSITSIEVPSFDQRKAAKEKDSESVKSGRSAKIRRVTRRDDASIDNSTFSSVAASRYNVKNKRTMFGWMKKKNNGDISK